MKQYLRIRSWDEYQHYKDRDPPWIKLHRKILTGETWVTLDDASRVLAVALMLLAAGTENRIPADKAYLKRVAYLNGDPDWSPLVRTQFIDVVDDDGRVIADASNALASGTECSSDQIRSEKIPTASATPSSKTVSRETDPDWWLDFKLAYPARAGDQGWRKAQRAAHARQSEGHTSAEFIEGAKRYAAFCEITGKTGTEFVKQAASFLGPDKPFLDPWSTPPRPNGKHPADPYANAI